MGPFTIAVRKIRCDDDTDEWGDDEPYVVVFTADLRTGSSRVTVTGPWEVDDHESYGTSPVTPGVDAESLRGLGVVWRARCWGLDGEPAAIDDPDNVLILVAFQENDDNDVTEVRKLVRDRMSAELAKVLTREPGRASRAEQLRDLFASAVDSAVRLDIDRATTGSDQDERVGKVQELRLAEKDLVMADEKGTQLLPALVFRGDGGADYKVFFEVAV